MPGSSSWIPYALQGVKGLNDDDDDDDDVNMSNKQSRTAVKGWSSSFPVKKFTIL
jgi:hypothetical protein